jgi:hypothetical protein
MLLAAALFTSLAALGCTDSRHDDGGGASGGGAPAPAPVVTALTPASGPAAGGTVVSVTGTGFQAGASMTIGGTPATSVSVFGPTLLTAVTPAGTVGAQNVTGTLTNGFTYTSGGGGAPAPVVSAIAPSSGTTAGGTSVSITGGNFVTNATVTIGGNAATSVVVVSAGVITAVTPAGTVGAQNVTVTNPDTQSGTLTGGFTYTAAGGSTPTITTVAPTTGAAAGGTFITITGTNFVAGATVSIGGVAATNVTVVSAGTITANTPRTPAGAAGPQTVVVTNPGGGSASWNTPGFTPVAIPVEQVNASASEPDVAVDGAGNVHVTWQIPVGISVGTDVVYSRSTDGGRTWSTPLNLSRSTNDLSRRPRLAARGATVFVVWNEQRSGTEYLYRASSTDSGATFGSPGALLNSGNWAPNPDVAIESGGKVVVAYESKRIVPGGGGGGGTSVALTYIDISSITGTATGPFGSAVVVASGTQCGRFPSMAAGGSGLAAVAYNAFQGTWPPTQSPAGYDVYAARTTDSGTTWGTPANVSNHTDDAVDAAVALNGSTVVLAWMQIGSNGFQMYTARSTDSGVSYGSPATVGGAATVIDGLGIGTDGTSGFTITWSAPGNGGAGEVWSARSVDGGATFGTAVNLSSNSGNSKRPQVAGGAAGFVSHVWLDDTAQTGVFDVLGW